MLRKTFISTLILLLSFFTFFMPTTFAQSLTLYTPYSGLSVTPGENITYDVDIINDHSSVEHVTFALEKLPKEWEYSIRAGGYSIDQLSILPNSEETIKVEVTVPLEVKKGAYSFSLVATNERGEKGTLPILVNVSEEGTFQTEFVIEQPNMQGHADSTLTYSAELKNQTADEQHYSLAGQFPEGWEGIFKVDGNSVTSVTIEPNESKNITIEMTPAENVKADLYTIPIVASTGSTSAEIEVEADIIGKYDVELTTTDGKMSSDLTAGRKKTIKLLVKNTGSVVLTDIKLDAQTPPDWDVEFDKQTINSLEAGEEFVVEAKVEAPKDTIAGDYVVNFSAKTSEASSEATFRMSVKTSTLWGFISVGIIVLVIAGIYFVFKKYGRR